MAEFSSWLQLHYQEIIGTIISLFYLYFSIIQNRWLWPLGFFSSAIYVLVFFKAGIYADMGLQLYYVIISVYGWFNWIKMNQNKSGGQINDVIKVPWLILLLLLITFIIFILLSQLLKYYTDSTIPYLDAFTTALSITATWMLAKKYIEHWLIWIVVDAVSSGVYFYKELHVTALLYIIYTVFAIVGYFMWLKSKQNNRIEFIQNNSLAI
jgi:nicotinamide mononucleotide transporter